MKRIIVLVLSLAVVLPVSAGYIFDLSLSGDVTGSGEIGFASREGGGYGTVGVDSFNFTVDSQAGALAPFPVNFGLADIAGVAWEADMVTGELIFLNLVTDPVTNGSAMYDLAFSLNLPATPTGGKKAVKKRVAFKNLLYCGGKAAINVVDGPSGRFCSNPDVNSATPVIVATAGALGSSALSVPEPPAMALFALGLLLLRTARRRMSSAKS